MARGGRETPRRARIDAQASERGDLVLEEPVEQAIDLVAAGRGICGEAAEDREEEAAAEFAGEIPGVERVCRVVVSIGEEAVGRERQRLFRFCSVVGDGGEAQGIGPAACKPGADGGAIEAVVAVRGIVDGGDAGGVDDGGEVGAAPAEERTDQADAVGEGAFRADPGEASDTRTAFEPHQDGFRLIV